MVMGFITDRAPSLICLFSDIVNCVYLYTLIPRKDNSHAWDTRAGLQQRNSKYESPNFRKQDQFAIWLAVYLYPSVIATCATLHAAQAYLQALAQDQVYTCVALSSAVAIMEHAPDKCAFLHSRCRREACLKQLCAEVIHRTGAAGGQWRACTGDAIDCVPASRGAYYALPAVYSSRYTYTHTRPLLHTCARIFPLPAILFLAAIYQKCLPLRSSFLSVVALSLLTSRKRRYGLERHHRRAASATHFPAMTEPRPRWADHGQQLS